MASKLLDAVKKTAEFITEEKKNMRIRNLDPYVIMGLSDSCNMDVANFYYINKNKDYDNNSSEYLYLSIAESRIVMERTRSRLYESGILNGISDSLSSLDNIKKELYSIFDRDEELIMYNYFMHNNNDYAYGDKEEIFKKLNMSPEQFNMIATMRILEFIVESYRMMDIKNGNNEFRKL